MKMVGLGQSAEALLAAFSTELLALNITVPKLQYVGSGEIPWDDESLTVYMGTIVQGQPGQAKTQSFVTTAEIITVVTFYVQLLRKVSTVGFNGQRNVLTPTMKDMNNEGLNAMNDAGALLQSAIQIKGQGKIVPLEVPFAIGPVLPLGPEGGMAAMRIGLEISIDGS